MRRQELEQKADQIEMVLSMNRAPGRVTGGQVTPRLVQFLAQPAPGGNVNRVEALTTEIALALGVPHATVTRQGGAVRIDVPRSDAQPVQLARMLSRIPADRVPPVTALLGLAEDGAPLLARFPSPEVGHVLISGKAGSGKTSLIVAMLLSLAYYNKPRDVQFILQGDGLACLRELPHVLNSVSDAAALVDRRMAEGSITTPRVIVAIDDMGAVDRRIVDTLIGKGARVGVHVIAAARDLLNLPVKVKITADHKSESKPGDFWTEFEHGVMRFDAAHIAGADLRSFIQAIRG